MLPEVARILALPVVKGEVRAPPVCLVPGGSLYLPDTPRRLRPGQLAALGEAQRANGLLGIIGVGQGKFLISVLSPSVISCERPLLLVPPALVKQTKAEIHAWGKHVRIHPALRVMSYNDLSTKGGEAQLQAIQPDLIIADEVHSLKRRESARTRRFIRWFQEHPDTRLVALSGTISSRSLTDYDHIAEMALREGSPLPRSWVEVEAWAACIDAKRDPPTPHQQAAAAPLLEAFPTLVRSVQASYYARLRSCPGVICTVDTSAAECSLRVEARRFLPPATLVEAITDLRKTWTLPDGTELLRASEFAAAVRQLQVGFYYVWDWGPAGPAQDWLFARAAWAKVVRDTLARNTPGVDSPAQVEDLVRSAGPAQARHALTAWEAIEDDHKPPQVARWVSYAVVDHVLDQVARLERERGPVLVWCDSIALLTACVDSGLRTLKPGDALPAKPTTLVLPRHSFGTGRNLQAWSTNLVLEPASSGTAWEQLIGRTHREGQEADDVLVEVPYWDGIALHYITEAKADAAYVENTTGQKQKLLLASYTNTGGTTQ